MTAPRQRRDVPRGVALVSVLLIVAVTTALAYEIANRHAFGVAISRQMLEASQAREYALGGEQYLRQVLYADWEDETTRAKDTLLEDWSTATQAFEVDDGSIELRVVDLQARFNLNSVVGAGGPENTARLKRLFTHLELDPSAVDAWVDWIDGDQEAEPTVPKMRTTCFATFRIVRRTARRYIRTPAAHLVRVARRLSPACSPCHGSAD